MGCWVLCLLAAIAAVSAQSSDGNWPQFRGRQASGGAEGHILPVRWNVKTGEHIKWRTSVPGLGLSSPVIWGDKLFLSTAVSEDDNGDLRLGLYGDIAPVEDESEHIWKVLCYDKNTGDLLWEREVHRGIPKVKRHTKSSHANSTLATDGERLIAFFGSEGLYCLDLNGKVLWSKDFGKLDAGYFKMPDAQWEFGNSPVIHSGHAIVLADAQENGFLSSFRLSDGKQAWRVERSDVPTWGAPLVVSTGDTTQVVVNGFKHAGGYDFESGKELWRVDGGGDVPVPTPINGDGLFFLTNAHGNLSPVYAVSHGQRGSIKLTNDSSEGLAWVARRIGSYMQTPLLYGDLLYVSRWNGIQVCLRPQSGEIVYRERLAPGAFTASPVAGDGKIYIASEEGDVYVVATGETYRLLATNRVGEPLLATPAISQGTLYFRTAQSLIAVE
jgi:outer membrane protein assembly factor BamB